MEALDRWAGKLALWSVWAAAVLVFLILLYGAADVILSYLFNRPLPSKIELSEALFAAAIFPAFALVTHRDENIRVDLFAMRFDVRLRRAFAALGDLAGGILFALIAREMLGVAVKAWTISEHTPGVIGLPLYPIKFAVFASTVLIAVICLLRAVTRFTGRKPARSHP